jgi:hypothetical protein
MWEKVEDPFLLIYPLDSERPVVGALREALHRAWNEMWELAQREYVPPEAGRSKRDAYYEKGWGAQRKWLELLRWVAAPERVHETLARLSGPGAAVARVIVDPHVSKRGRPPIKRQIAVQAYQLQLADPKAWTWAALARKLCNCGAVRHQKNCSENLRREVVHLKTLLKSCGISGLPPRKKRPPNFSQ